MRKCAMKWYGTDICSIWGLPCDDEECELSKGLKREV